MTNKIKIIFFLEKKRNKLNKSNYEKKNLPLVALEELMLGRLIAIENQTNFGCSLHCLRCGLRQHGCVASRNPKQPANIEFSCSIL